MQNCGLTPKYPKKDHGMLEEGLCREPDLLAVALSRKRKKREETEKLSGQAA